MHMHAAQVMHTHTAEVTHMYAAQIHVSFITYSKSVRPGTFNETNICRKDISVLAPTPWLSVLQS